MLMKYLVDHELTASQYLRGYFFFGALGPSEDTISKALCALVYQVHTNYCRTMNVV